MRLVEAELAEAEASLGALQAQTSDLNARRAALERSIRDEMERAARFASEKERVERDIATLSTSSDDLPPIDLLREDMAMAEDAVQQAEEAVLSAREELAAAREAESRLRQPLNEAERRAQQLETEARTLAKLFTSQSGDLWPPALDQITVQKGYETALGAALGDDLDASTNPSAPAHWAETGAGENDPALPPGIAALASVASAPAALQRRLSQVGIVSTRGWLAAARRSETRPAAGVAGRRSLALGWFHHRRRGAVSRRTTARREEPAGRS